MNYTIIDGYVMEPCPFCGGKPRKVASGSIIECSRCEASTGWFKKFYNAAKAWNRRAANGPVVPEREPNRD